MLDNNLHFFIFFYFRQKLAEKMCSPNTLLFNRNLKILKFNKFIIPDRIPSLATVPLTIQQACKVACLRHTVGWQAEGPKSPQETWWRVSCPQAPADKEQPMKHFLVAVSSYGYIRSPGTGPLYLIFTSRTCHCSLLLYPSGQMFKLVALITSGTSMMSVM
jgi:hypothetical protein